MWQWRGNVAAYLRGMCGIRGSEGMTRDNGDGSRKGGEGEEWLRRLERRGGEWAGEVEREKGEGGGKDGRGEERKWGREKKERGGRMV